MRFQSAALVAALATGAVSAPSAHHHKHMQLHAAREAEAAPFDYKNGVDWSKVSITGVDWSTVDYTGGKGKSAATSIAAAPAAATSQAAGPVAQGVENKVVAPASHAAQSAASAPSSSPSSSGGSNLLSNAVDTAVGDVSSMVQKLSNNAGGVKIKQASTNNAFCSMGSSGPYVLEATNKKTEDMLLVIWNSNSGYQSSFVGSGVEAPVMTVGIPAGKTQQITFQSGTSGAMAPVWSKTAPSQYGQISNTWLEFTFTPGGTVDVSREINMNGDAVSAVTSSGGNTCTTDMNQCSFHCNSGTSCKDAQSYTLVNCSGPLAQNGKDNNGGSSGGCGLGHDAKSTVKASFG